MGPYKGLTEYKFTALDRQPVPTRCEPYTLSKVTN